MRGYTSKRECIQKLNSIMSQEGPDGIACIIQTASTTAVATAGEKEWNDSVMAARRVFETIALTLAPRRSESFISHAGRDGPWDDLQPRVVVGHCCTARAREAKNRRTSSADGKNCRGSRLRRRTEGTRRRNRQILDCGMYLTLRKSNGLRTDSFCVVRTPGRALPRGLLL